MSQERRSRPAAGRGVIVGVQCYGHLLVRVDEWRRNETDLPTRATGTWAANTVNPKTKRIMGMAFEWRARRSMLQIKDDLPLKLIVRKIIELAKAGERDPDRPDRRHAHDAAQRVSAAWHFCGISPGNHSRSHL
jgi:hypothetical protein